MKNSTGIFLHIYSKTTFFFLSNQQRGVLWNFKNNKNLAHYDCEWEEYREKKQQNGNAQWKKFFCHSLSVHLYVLLLKKRRKKCHRFSVEFSCLWYEFFFIKQNFSAANFLFFHLLFHSLLSVYHTIYGIQPDSTEKKL